MAVTHPIRADQNAVAPSSSLEDAEIPALMEVELNGVATGEVLLFLPRNNQLLMVESGFDRLNLRKPRGPVLSQDGLRFHPLDPETSFQLDEERQIVSIIAKPEAFQLSVITAANTPGDKPVVDHPMAAFVNYDLVGQGGGGANLIGGEIEGVASTRWGTASTSASSVAGHRSRLARLDTAYRRDWQDGLSQLTIGDGILPGGFMGTPIRFGGIQFGRDFSLDPGYIAYPLASLRGEAALPSTMEIYIDNALRYSGEVQPGPFEVKSLPVLSGAGQAEIVLKDPLGRTRTVQSSFYAAPQLLADHTHDFTYALGAERLEYGQSNFSYGTPFVSALHRYGLTDSLTGEFQATVSRSSQTGGLSAGKLIPQLGIVNLGVAASRRHDGGGVRVRLAFSREMQGYNLNASYIRTSKSFEAPGKADTSLRSVEELHAGAGVSLGDYGSISAGFDRLRLANGSSTNIASLQYGIGVGPGYLSAYGSTIRDRRTSVFAGLTFTIPLGTSNTITMSSERNDGRQAARFNASGRIAEGGSVGYYTSFSRGLTQQIEGGIDWQSPWLDLSIAAHHGEGQSAGRIAASGTVVAAGGHAMLGQPINDAFAIIEVPGQPDVPVFLENRPAGRTDDSGFALLTGLVANQQNHVRVAADNMPIEISIPAEEIVLVQPRRGLASARFEIASQKGVLGRAILEDGSPVPAGAIVETGTGEISFIGINGEFFLSNAVSGEAITVRWLQKSCTMRISTQVEPTILCREYQ